jgi:hypothetical protein
MWRRFSRVSLKIERGRESLATSWHWQRARAKKCERLGMRPPSPPGGDAGSTRKVVPVNEVNLAFSPDVGNKAIGLWMGDDAILAEMPHVDDDVRRRLAEKRARARVRKKLGITSPWIKTPVRAAPRPATLRARRAQRAPRRVGRPAARRVAKATADPAPPSEPPHSGRTGQTVGAS